MPLTKSEIQSLGLIRPDREKGYRLAGYDLAIDTILVAPPADRASSASSVIEYREAYTLHSAGMVKVISKELIKLPPDIVGYALVKNAMSNKGVLAINIGVIDPGYEGPISSTLINFGRDSLVLRPGESFLRLTFHKIDSADRDPVLETFTREEYLENAKAQLLETGSDKFLNLSSLSEQVIQEALERLQRWWWAGVVLVASALGILALAVPVYAAIWTMSIEAFRRWLAPLIQSI